MTTSEAKTNAPAAAELAPCPFCASDQVEIVEKQNGFFLDRPGGPLAIFCRDCGVTVKPSLRVSHSRDKTIAFWNCRMTDARIVEFRRPQRTTKLSPCHFCARDQVEIVPLQRAFFVDRGGVPTPTVPWGFFCLNCGTTVKPNPKASQSGRNAAIAFWNQSRNA